MAEARSEKTEKKNELAYLTRRQRLGVEAAEADTIGWFVSGRTDDRIVISENSPLHPGGNLFVGGDQPAQPGYRTQRVMELLGARYLIEMDGPGERLDRPHQDPVERMTPRQGQPGDPRYNDRMFPPGRGVEVRLEPAGETEEGHKLMKATAEARRSAAQARDDEAKREAAGTAQTERPARQTTP